MAKAVGGCGLGRGRRNPKEFRVGDALDFWKVAEKIVKHATGGM